MGQSRQKKSFHVPGRASSVVARRFGLRSQLPSGCGTVVGGCPLVKRWAYGVMNHQIIQDNQSCNNIYIYTVLYCIYMYPYNNYNQQENIEELVMNQQYDPKVGSWFHSMFDFHTIFCGLNGQFQVCRNHQSDFHGKNARVMNPLISRHLDLSQPFSSIHIDCSATFWVNCTVNWPNCGTTSTSDFDPLFLRRWFCNLASSSCSSWLKGEAPSNFGAILVDPTTRGGGCGEMAQRLDTVLEAFSSGCWAHATGEEGGSWWSNNNKQQPSATNNKPTVIKCG